MSLMSSETHFTPRPEFIRDPSPTLNSFSLVAIAGTSSIKLYSFPLPVVNSVRRLLEHKKLACALREDVEQQICELTLTAKPWSSPKSLPSEKLLTDILAVIYQHGYSYVSTMDYGRESDDRLAMAFSRPFSRSLSPSSPSGSPVAPSLTLNVNKRVPFSLSFTSSTTLRVISPPLHSTPAILQAVRGSWPRGVVSEKKVWDNCYEFKLKGYKWFHEDTFATDSLRHILALLSSLDVHSFSLVASITLTKRSRVKDLWIFTGLAPLSEPSMQGSPSTSLNRFGASSPNALQSQQSLHRRLASEPVATNSGTTYTHARAATDSPDSQGSGLRNSKLLRKPAPRAQVPVSAYEGEERLPVAEPVRAHLPSVISEGGDDLTGVGASGRTPDVFYATSPFGPHNAPPLPMRPTDLPHERFQSRSNPPSLGSGSHSPSPRSSPHPNATPPREESPHGVFLHDHPSGTDSLSYSGPLLGSSAFRDTTFSDATNSTYATAIPIKWTGDERESAAPNIPGGWQSTPITEEPFSEEEEEEEEDDEEDEEDEEDDDLDEHDLPTPDVQQVPRVNSPDVQSPDVTLRKSEAGLVGLIAASETPPVPADGGKGWVLVDIDGQPGPGDSSPVAPSPATPAPSDHSRKATPAAKAIAVMDAVEAKGKSPTASKSEGSSQVVSDADTRNAIDLVKSATTDSKQSKPKTRLRDRLRLRG